MHVDGPRVLIIGYGNQARGDDGLGPELARICEDAALLGITVDIDYQLSVEHAYDAAQHDVVVFLDAMLPGSDPFCIRPVDPDAVCSLGSHSVSPEVVMRLVRDLYERDVSAHTLGISGESFGEFEEGLSATARRNLLKAKGCLEDFLSGEFGFQVRLQEKQLTNA